MFAFFEEGGSHHHKKHGSHHHKKHGSGIYVDRSKKTKKTEKTKGVFETGVKFAEKITGLDQVKKLSGHGKEISKAGGIITTVGDVVSLIGVATGQPEIVAAGGALDLTGRGLTFAGDISQKQEERKEKRKERGLEDKDTTEETISDVIDTVDFLGEAAGVVNPDLKPIVGQIGDLTNQFRPQQEEISLLEDIVKQEDSIIQEESQIIKGQADTINELTDRLVSQLDPPVSTDDFLTQLRNLEGFTSMVSLINNNKSSYESLSQSDKNKIMDLVLLNIGVN